MFLDAWFPIGVLFFCALCLLTYGAVSLVELSSSDIFKFVAAIFIGAGAGMALFRWHTWSALRGLGCGGWRYRRRAARRFQHQGISIVSAMG